MPLLRRTGFGRKLQTGQATRDRSEEFASFTIEKPRARMATNLAERAAAAESASVLVERIDPDPGPSSAAGRRHMGRVAALGCRLCIRLGFGATPCEVHHIREGQGGAQRASDFLTLGLCPEHHRGPSGLHGDNSALRIAKVTELDLLADTIAVLAGDDL